VFITILSSLELFGHEQELISCRLRTNVMACIEPTTFAFACNLLQLVWFSLRQDVRAATVVFFLELQKTEVRQLNNPARVY